MASSPLPALSLQTWARCWAELRSLVRVGVLMMICFGLTTQQTDFSKKDVNGYGKAAGPEGFIHPITCYACRGTAVNSTCADPVDPRNNPHLEERKCNNGVCLKWTKYQNGVLHMIRTCSADLNFHLTMIDGVCRTERNGNGNLCMCGKHLCNSAQILAVVEPFPAVLLSALFFTVIVNL